MGEITWSIVKFLDEDAVEAVPTSWLLGSNKCYWPPFPKEKLVNCIRKQERPKTCWPLHNVMLFRNGTYDEYIVARNKARKAENTSDLNSDSDIKSRKLKKKKTCLSSSDEENEFVSKLPSPPKMPKTAKPNTESLGPLQELMLTDIAQAAPHISNNKNTTGHSDILSINVIFLTKTFPIFLLQKLAHHLVAALTLKWVTSSKLWSNNKC
ncbi:hypothetical protein JTB14_013720 [Gonioctena quinquepunctata]|nr:hypothetical protein JTB14_013720 [Gonioctena quinquepunctata]